ncbi:MAG: glycosyltransferase family protein [Myxococcota bacterium]
MPPICHTIHAHVTCPPPRLRKPDLVWALGGNVLKTVYYGVAGEGRGHAARALAIIEQLHERHRVVVYSYGQALSLLKSACRSLDVEVRTLPSLEFSYTSQRTLSYSRTFFRNVGYLKDLSDIFSRIQIEMERTPPDLIVSDFEPVLPRVGRRLGVPFLSVDHQHFLLACDIRELPARLRPHAQWMGVFIKAFCPPGPSETVISSFFPYRVRPRYAFAKQVGVMMRRQILEAQPEDRGHLVAYVRRAETIDIVPQLHALGRPARVYGLGQQPRFGNVEFKEIHPNRFLEDLSTATGLVTTAGNQLVGEALYLGKPVFAVPEPKNREQDINAHFVQTMGVGESVAADLLSKDELTSFLDKVPFYRARINRQRMCGNAIATRIIEDHLSGVYNTGERPRTSPRVSPAHAVA